MNNDWLSLIKRAKKSCIVQNNLKKVHYAFENGKQMVEEYNMDTNVLTRRAWKVNIDFGGEGEWEIEIGDPEPAGLKSGSEFIKENQEQPFITRRLTKINLEWRIRNLPYSIETYTVTAEPDKKCITVRTANKKYFKQIQIPELDRVNLLPEQNYIAFTHKFNTLIITYKKPEAVLALEKAVFAEVQKLKTQEGAADLNNCKPS